MVKTVLWFILALSATGAAATPFYVDSEEPGWQNSGVIVKTGQQVVISAKGKVRVWSGQATYGVESFADPDGWHFDCGTGKKTRDPAPYQNSIAPGIGYIFGLVVKIGENGTPFFVGSQYNAVARESGNLYFAISETNLSGGCTDNEGVWIVTSAVNDIVKDDYPAMTGTVPDSAKSITFCFDPGIHSLAHHGETGQNKKVSELAIKEVWLVGDFNAWGRNPAAMTRNDDGNYVVSLSPDQCGGPGDHQYKYVINKVWWVEPSTVNAGILVPVEGILNTKNYALKIGELAAEPAPDRLVTFYFIPLPDGVAHQSQTGKAKKIENIPIKTVMLAGSFNDWGRQSTEMREISDGMYAVTISSKACGGPGTHQYKYVINDEWWVEPLAEFNEFTVLAGDEIGSRNNLIVINSPVAGPDMTVADVQADFESVRAKKVRLQVVLKNIGEPTMAPFLIKYYVNNEVIEREIYTIPIAAGQSQTTGITCRFNKPGEYELMVEVTGLTGEQNISNNSRKITVVVER